MRKKKVFNYIDKTGKETLKVTTEKKEKGNGKHCLQRAVWQDGGITFVGKFLLLLPLIARRKMCESRHLAKPLGRWVQCEDSTAENTYKTEYLRQQGKTCKAVRAGEIKKITYMNEIDKKMFLGLCQMVLADGEVHPKELELLYQIGKVRGISEEDIQRTIFSPQTFLKTEDLNDEEKIEFLYNLARMAWADDELDDSEIETLQKTSKWLGFSEENVVEISEFLLEQAKEKKSFEEVLQTIKNS